MLLNPVIATLRNTATGRFHPIVFVESPLPGPPNADKPVRHKSKGHHTLGFATRDESDLHSTESLKPACEAQAGTCRLKLDTVFEWDGADVPAMVQFFD